jgi:multidrug efflux pump
MSASKESVGASGSRAHHRRNAKVRDAIIFAISPPPIPELGRGTGFVFRLQDRGDNGHTALVAARNRFLGLAAQSPLLSGVRPDGLEDAPQLQLDIDPREGQRVGRVF